MKQEELNIICGERLRKCIDEKNMKHKEVAAASNFTEQHISNLVRGKCKLTTDTARILSRVLGVRMEYLLCEDDCKTNYERFQFDSERYKAIPQSICKILESKGYELFHDEYTSKYNSFKTVILSYPFEIDGKSDKEIHENITEKLEMASEQYMISLKHPDGRIVRISSEHFQNILSDIEKYIDFKMYTEYNAPENYMFPADMERKKKDKHL